MTCPGAALATERLDPAAPVLARGPGAVQVGTSPQRALVLEGLTPADLDVLALLAGGTGVGPGAAGVAALAGACGADPRRATALLTALREAGLLVPRTGDARTRAVTAVTARDRPEVRGRGPAADAVRALLATEALPHGGEAATHGPPQERAGGAPRDGGGPPVVLVARGAVLPEEAAPLLAGDRVHLPVVVREVDAEVGPLVRPGHGPCLRCCDLVRRDRDPAWPAVLLAMAAAPPRPAEDPLLAALAAAHAVALLRAALTGATTPGAAVVVGLDGSVRRDRWVQHPACGCAGPVGA